MQHQDEQLGSPANAADDSLPQAEAMGAILHHKEVREHVRKRGVWLATCLFDDDLAREIVAAAVEDRSAAISFSQDRQANFYYAMAELFAPADAGEGIGGIESLAELRQRRALRAVLRWAADALERGEAAPDAVLRVVARARQGAGL